MAELKKKTLPFDAGVLDDMMSKIDGMEVAKHTLASKLNQRIIFASAYVKVTLGDSIKQLKQIVELFQKPFEFVHAFGHSGGHGDLWRAGNIERKELKNQEPEPNS